MEKELQPDLLDFNIYARVDLRSHQTQRIDMAEAPAHRHIRTYARAHSHTRRSASSRLQLKWTRLRRRC